ncbi:type II toxin-antitoxin system ParD family antitoxin [Micropruina sp.]|uniref:type II toxin-antitoxin system ParD family antitoxin n=1 Tax=Micropruina sp. TaxID=2737536 RepID=UPI0039E2D9ED
MERAIPISSEDHATQLAALRAALIEGEESGKPEPFDLAALIASKRPRARIGSLFAPAHEFRAAPLKGALTRGSRGQHGVFGQGDGDCQSTGPILVGDVHECRWAALSGGVRRSSLWSLGRVAARHMLHVCRARDRSSSFLQAEAGSQILRSVNVNWAA